MKEHTVSAYKKAIELFKKIKNWKDSSAKIYDCERGISEIEQKEEADRIEAERLAEEKRLEERIAEEKRIADAKAAQKRKKIIAITAPIVCVCIAFIIALNTIIIPNGKYNDALVLMDSQKYEDAAIIFEKINNYKDSTEKRKECLYQQAVIYRNDKKWNDANKIFETIKEYKDSKDLLHYHDYSVIDSKDASCTESGYKYFKCNCGEEYTNNILALGHSYSEATCTEAKKCSRCGKTDGTALGHITGTTHCTRCSTILFETLKYSGSDAREISLTNIPRGNYKLTLTSSRGSGIGGWCTVRLYKSESGSATLDSHPSGDVTTEYFSESIANGKLYIFCSNYNWSITIEAE